MLSTTKPSVDAAANLSSAGAQQVIVPSLQDLSSGHRVFAARESRDVFYRIATEAVERSLIGESSLSVPEAIAVLLETWNAAYYRFRPGDRERLIDDLKELIDAHSGPLAEFRTKTLSAFTRADEPVVYRLFRAFRGKLGAVGAAKALHLLAPRFFPLWDTSIAVAYEMGQMDAKGYLEFMALTRTQVRALGGEAAIEDAVKPTTGVHALKLLDELNYSRFSKHWIDPQVNRPAC